MSLITIWPVDNLKEFVWNCLPHDCEDYCGPTFDTNDAFFERNFGLDCGAGSLLRAASSRKRAASRTTSTTC